MPARITSASAFKSSRTHMRLLKSIKKQTHLLGPLPGDNNDAIPIEVQLSSDEAGTPVSLRFTIGDGEPMTCCPEDIERIAKAIETLRRGEHWWSHVCADHGYYKDVLECPVCEHAEKARQAARVLAEAPGGEFT